jgi:hypothetical protein
LLNGAKSGMRISEIFNLEKTQRELDFVDVDLNTDCPLFIDTNLLAVRVDRWSEDAARTVRSFFQYVIELVQNGYVDTAKLLFEHLSEPSETFLGISQDRPMGRGVGERDATEIFNSMISSGAIESGLVEDLQDSVVFVDGVGKDKLSDMTTNIIRHHLITYTQSQCRVWGLTLTPDVPSGFYWDSASKSWMNSYEDMLIIEGKKVLLVPKAIVSYSKAYTSEQYHQHFVLNFLQDEHLRLNTSLVRTRMRKDGTLTRFVTKKELKEKVAPLTKDFLRDFTRRHPEVYADFKRRTSSISKPMKHTEFAELYQEDFDPSDFTRYLIEKLCSIPKGTKSAGQYHAHIIGVLDYIFYPNLINPQKEQEIHQGRKRIDLTFDNSANQGFFHQLHDVAQIPCQYIFVECKNYSSDPTNPELDQLSGRFSVNRGQFGLLMCREIGDLGLFLQRCRDTYDDRRGLIIPIVDTDLINILNRIIHGDAHPEEALLTERKRRIVLG